MADFLFGPGPIVWIQQTIGYGHETLFLLFSVFGTAWGVLLGVGIALWLWGREDAYTVVGAIALEVCINLLINQLVSLPRPDDAAVRVYIDVQVSSFPSGHTFTAVVVWGVLAARGRVPWLLASALVAITALGRLYLGTHYVGDIVGGLAFGALLVWAWSRAWPHLKQRLSRFSFAAFVAAGVCVVLGAAALVVFVLGGDHAWSALGLMAGAVAALLLEYRFVRYDPGAAGPGRRALQLAIGLAGVALPYSVHLLSGGIAVQLTAVLLALASLWALLAVPAIFAGTALAPRTELERPHAVHVWGHTAAGIAILTLAAVLYAFAIEPRLILDVEEVRAPIPGLPPEWEGQRIAVTGDFQTGLFLDNANMVERVARRLVEMRPAAVVLLGDFLYHAGDDLEEIDRVVHHLAPLFDSGIPVFAVLGNHDWGMQTRTARADTRQGTALIERLEHAGVEVLQNEAAPLRAGNSDLYIVGVAASYPGLADPRAALGRVPAGAPRVVAMHNPAAFPDFPPGSAPIATAGHTHGGQFRIPFTPEWSWLTFSRDDEVHTDGWVEENYGARGNRLYINRGIGMSIVPMRFNCPPEITVLRLTGTDAASESPRQPPSGSASRVE